MDLDDLSLLAAQAVTPQDRGAIENQRRAVHQPIADMFQELKDRLNDLLPPAEQAAASRPAVAQAVAPRPAGQRRSRAGRTPTTQPAGPTG